MSIIEFTNNNLIQKTLVTIAIEIALLEIDKETYYKVIHDLYEKHQCYLSDCYEHPEYLCEILHELYGNTHDIILEKIKKQLGEFSYQKPIERFLDVISH